MIGSLWFVYEYEDGTKPKSLKEFNSNADFSEILHLPKGIFVPQNQKINEHIKFDCIRPEYKESILFKLFLYENNHAEGWITYHLNEGIAKEYFKGSYKKYSNSDITIWGTWEYGINRKESSLILIEFKKVNTEEIEKTEIERKNKINQRNLLDITKKNFFEPHSDSSLKKMHKIFSQSKNNLLYIPIEEELERRKKETLKK